VTSPRILRVEPGNETEAIREAVTALERGNLVILPTDTVYGIAADPRLPGSGGKLCIAKGRDRDKPIPLLAADIESVEAYGAVLGTVERSLAAAFWPGPLTLVLPVRRSRAVSPRENFEGFRVPDHAVTRALLRAVDGVLRATSANRSGRTDALTAEEAVGEIGSFVDIVLDAGPAVLCKPSTVARVQDGRIEILREGAVDRQRLLAVSAPVSTGIKEGDTG